MMMSNAVSGSDKTLLLKGGERMYFRHFILMGVILGAAAFLPNNALANGAVGQPEQQNAAAQTRVSANAENPIASEKEVPVPTENVHKSQGEVVQKPEANPSTQKSIPIKSVSASPNKTNRAVPPLDKGKNASKSAEQTAKVKDIGQPGPAKPNVDTNQVQEVPESTHSNQTAPKAEMDSQPSGLIAKSETITEENDSSVSIKTSISQEPLIVEESKAPSNDRKIPFEVINILPQLTSSPGGQSDVQFSPGTGAVGYIANWLDWDEHLSLTLGLNYTSRQAKYSHQWINAPPSPPPEIAPFFKTLTAN